MADFLENFDGVTAPAMPSTVTVEVGTIVTSTAHAKSGTNSAKITGTNSTVPRLRTISSGVPADSKASCWLWLGAKDQYTEFFLGNRVDANATLTARKGYWLEIAVGSADTNPGLSLEKGDVGGSAQTQLGSTVGNAATFNATEWYYARIQCTGSSTTRVQAFIQRASDSKWLTSGGTWDSTEQAAIDANDSSSPYTAAGQAEICTFYYITTTDHYVDNFALASAVVAGSIVVTGPSSGPAAHQTSDFTFTPSATITSDTCTPSTTYGTWSPSSLTWTASSAPQTSKFTPAAPSSGAITLTFAMSGSTPTPSSVAFTALNHVSLTGTTSTTGDNREYIIPWNYTSGAIKCVVWHHGSGGDELMMSGGAGGDAQAQLMFNALVNAGYMLISCAGHSATNWGNAAAVADVANMVADVTGAYSVSHWFVLGGSMGGLWSLNSIKAGAIPGFKGWIGVCPVCDLAWAHANGFGSAIDAAYPSGYTGHDPMTFSWSTILATPVPMAFVASLGDTTVTMTDNSLALSVIVHTYSTETPVLIASDSASHGMHSWEPYYAVDAFARWANPATGGSGGSSIFQCPFIKGSAQ